MSDPLELGEGNNVKRRPKTPKRLPLVAPDHGRRSVSVLRCLRPNPSLDIPLYDNKLLDVGGNLSLHLSLLIK